MTLPTHWNLSSAAPLRLLCPVFPWSRLPHILLGVCLVCHLTLGSSAQHWLKQTLKRQSQVYCLRSFLSNTRIQTLQRPKFPEYIYIYVGFSFFLSEINRISRFELTGVHDLSTKIFTLVWNIIPDKQLVVFQKHYFIWNNQFYPLKRQLLTFSFKQCI